MLAAAVVCVLAARPSQASDVDVRIVDGRVSIQAQAAPLGELLAMLDRVAGTESTVRADLAERSVSAWFTALSLDDAVDKIFEGSGLDYVVMGGRRIVVTAPSAAGSSFAAAPAGFAPPVPGAPSTPATNPFQLGAVPANAPPGAGPPGAAVAAPSVIQTPFGAIIGASARDGESPPAAPPVPGQGAFPGAGAPATGDQPSIFGNTSPPIMDLNKQAPAPPPGAPGLPFPPPNPSPAPPR